MLEYAVNASGIFTSAGVTVAGVGGRGSGLSQLNDPGAVALDAKGDLFVADGGNNRVLEYAVNASGVFTSAGVTVAGAGGEGSELNQLESPRWNDIDAQGNLFVADGDNGQVLEYGFNVHGRVCLQRCAGGHVAKSCPISGLRPRR